ncbi:MAG: tRNA 2-thiouridine(34) synthase MnmA [Actinobacteria bacterium]|nr:tRNA 2-thiouridine(34) synthase MnmA [Actinomycetota bacterium]
MPESKTSVLVGLSGGVDSAVAAMLLVRAGHRVCGVTFSLWTDPDCRGQNLCCSSDTLLAAERIAEDLGITHEVVDLSADFYADVVRPFVEGYARGCTPNPCVACNAYVRVPALLRKADEMGYRLVATGHYARMQGTPPRLHRGRSQAKDQSYVLAGVQPALLERLLFPLGDLTKAQVRSLALQAGLDVGAQAESQEICFIPDNDHRRFLATRLTPKPGLILDHYGREIGKHDGIHRFTIGQRRGLGVAATEPLYVLEIRQGDGVVIVGAAEFLAVRRLTVRELVWHRRPVSMSGLTVQIRSMGRAVPVHVIHYEEEVLELDLECRERAAAPGQAAVLYSGDAVVCGGIIATSKPE